MLFFTQYQLFSCTRQEDGCTLFANFVHRLTLTHLCFAIVILGPSGGGMYESRSSWEGLIRRQFLSWSRVIKTDLFGYTLCGLGLEKRVCISCFWLNLPQSVLPYRHLGLLSINLCKTWNRGSVVTTYMNSVSICTGIMYVDESSATCMYSIIQFLLSSQAFQSFDIVDLLCIFQPSPSPDPFLPLLPGHHSTIRMKGRRKISCPKDERNSQLCHK